LCENLTLKKAFFSTIEFTRKIGYNNRIVSSLNELDITGFKRCQVELQDIYEDIKVSVEWVRDKYAIQPVFGIHNVKSEAGALVGVCPLGAVIITAFGVRKFQELDYRINQPAIQLLAGRWGCTEGAIDLILFGIDTEDMVFPIRCRAQEVLDFQQLGWKIKKEFKEI